MKRTGEEMINDLRELLEPILEVMDEALKQDIVINFSIGVNVDAEGKRKNVIQMLSTTKQYPAVRPADH